MSAVLQPESLGEARDALAGAARDRSSLEACGAAESASWAPAYGTSDVVVDTRRLKAPLKHRAGDLTLRATAGWPLEELQAEVARAGQFIAPAPPGPGGRATIGGAISAGDAGPLRHRYGTWRDVVIGTTVVLADGTVARSGGQVIKNVAGYDLAKLFCGAHGTLGLLAEVVLRLHPLAEHRVCVRAPSSPSEAAPLVAGVLASELTPSTVDFALGCVFLRFEGTLQGARQQARLAADLARLHGLAAELLEGEEEQERYEEVAVATAGRKAAGGGGEERTSTVVRAVTPPAAFGRAAEALSRSADEAGLRAELASHAGIGVHTARLAGGDARAHKVAVERWREAVAALGGSVAVREHAAGLEEAGLLSGPPPPALALMRRVKAAFDPEGRMAPGRFAPWW